MRKNEDTQLAENVAKGYAKKQAGKVARKAASKIGNKTAKVASKLAAKIIAYVTSSIGAPAAITILIAVIFLQMLPSAIFSSSLGIDNFTSQQDITDVGAGEWEEDAQDALNSRYRQLTNTSFWNDMRTFFTTGSWGTTNSTFKTEYADADDLDENGESVSEGYFSASNRMIAVINQAFIVSKDDATANSGIFFQSPAMKKAKKLAVSMSNDRGSDSFYQKMRNQYPQVPEENITIEYEKKSNTNEDFVYQACYLVAACSSRLMVDDELNVSVREILNKAFYITGIDNPDGETQKICWDPVVTPSESYREEIKTKRVYSHTIIVPYDVDGDGVISEGEGNEKRIYKNVSYTEYYLDIEYEYTVELCDNFEELVTELCAIEENVPADSAEYEISQAKQVNTSAIELFKLYNDLNVNLGVVGLPLPENTYSIGEGFGCMCEVHAPSGHDGQDLPASNGTSVFAVADGTVSYTQKGRTHNTHTTGREMYGNCVFITHNDGTQTRYGHLSAVYVSDGDIVSAGDLIGAVGNTGYSFGNHLHFEMRVDNDPVDPMRSEIGILIRENAR